MTAAVDAAAQGAFWDGAPGEHVHFYEYSQKPPALAGS